MSRKILTLVLTIIVVAGLLMGCSSGTLKYESGEVMYEGDLKDEKQHGFGKYYNEDGILVYEGNWENGKRAGEGKSYFDNKELEYEGEWKDDNFQGSGKVYNEEGKLIYEGDFMNNLYHGEGSHYASDGAVDYEGQWIEGNRVVTVVNDKPITEVQFNTTLEFYKNAYESSYGEEIWSQDMGDGNTFEDVVKTEVMETLIIEELLLQNAEALGTLVSEEEITEALDNYKTMFETEEEYNNFLQGNNITEDYLKSQIKSEILFTNSKKDYFEGLEITEEDINTHFEQNKTMYIQLKASHILVNTEEEALDIIDQLNNGASFSELAKEKSTDTGSSINGGDLGYFGKGSMVEAFDEVVFNLDIGEISEPVQSEFGYHIIRLEDRIDNLEEVRDFVIEDLKNDAYNKMLQDLKAEANIKEY